MVSFTTANGLLQFEDRETTIELLKNQQLVEAKAKADAAELSKSYSVKTLAERLSISETAAYDLIRQGRIGYCCAGGAKGYRVSERAVRRFEDNLPPLAIAA